jgi:hypothetical protein
MTRTDYFVVEHNRATTKRVIANSSSSSRIERNVWPDGRFQMRVEMLHSALLARSVRLIPQRRCQVPVPPGILWRCDGRRGQNNRRERSRWR